MPTELQTTWDSLASVVAGGQKRIALGCRPVEDDSRGGLEASTGYRQGAIANADQHKVGLNGLRCISAHCHGRSTISSGLQLHHLRLDAADVPLC